MLEHLWGMIQDLLHRFLITNGSFLIDLRLNTGFIQFGVFDWRPETVYSKVSLMPLSQHSRICQLIEKECCCGSRLLDDKIENLRILVLLIAEDNVNAVIKEMSVYAKESDDDAIQVVFGILAIMVQIISKLLIYRLEMIRLLQKA